jgi:hypothetical protein
LAKTKAPKTFLETTNHETLAAIGSLYTAQYGNLLDIAGSNRTMLPMEPDALVSSLADLLKYYTGELTDSAFQLWSEEVMTRAVDFYANMKTHQLNVYDGIWRMAHGYTDLLEKPNKSVEPIKRPLTSVDEINQDVWTKVFENLYDLFAPGQKAAVGTRLNAIGYWSARTWITLRIRAIEKFCDLEDHEKGKKRKTFIFPKDDGDDVAQPSKIVADVEADVDAIELSRAIAAADAPEPKRRKRSKMSDPGPNWGRPTIGALLLCHVCEQVRAVSEVAGYFATLECGHSRSTSSDSIYSTHSAHEVPEILKAA